MEACCLQAGIFEPAPAEEDAIATTTGLLLNCINSGLYMANYNLILPPITEVCRHIGVKNSMVGIIVGACDIATVFGTVGELPRQPLLGCLLNICDTHSQSSWTYAYSSGDVWGDNPILPMAHILCCLQGTVSGRTPTTRTLSLPALSRVYSAMCATACPTIWVPSGFSSWPVSSLALVSP